jgi:hypothetical protein
MTIRRKRGDTHVGTVEKQYGVDLGARSDMKLSRYLDREGFGSLSEAVRHHQREQAVHRVFLSFDYDDIQQVQGFRLLKWNSTIELDLHDASLRAPIDSDRAPYIKQKIRENIRRASVTVCLIGPRTYSSKWVEWEIRTSSELGKGLLGIRLKGCNGNGPAALRACGARTIDWEPSRFQSAIDRAALSR